MNTYIIVYIIVGCRLTQLEKDSLTGLKKRTLGREDIQDEES